MAYTNRPPRAANIIFRSTVDESMGDAIKVTVIATGFDGDSDIVVVDEAVAAVETGDELDAIQELARKSSQSRPAARSVTLPAPKKPAQRPARTDHAARAERDPFEDAVQSSRRRLREDAREAITTSASPAGRPRDSRYLVARSEEIDWDTPAHQRRGG